MCFGDAKRWYYVRFQDGERTITSEEKLESELSGEDE
jgi:hypothetical protein